MSNSPLYVPSRNTPPPPFDLVLLFSIWITTAALKRSWSVFRLKGKYISLCGRSPGGSAVLAAAAVQPAIWCRVAKRCWQPEGYQLRGSKPYNWQSSSFLITSMISNHAGNLEIGAKDAATGSFWATWKMKRTIASFCICCTWAARASGSWLQRCLVKPSWQSPLSRGE